MAIPIPLIALAAFMFSKSKKTLEDLEFEPKSIIWSKTKKQFVLYMDIVNPRSQNVKVDSMFLGVFDNDTKIGSVERKNSFTIKKNDRTLVSLPVKFNSLGIITSLLAFVAEKKTVEYIYETDENGKIKTDEEGKQIVKKDKNGKPMKKKSAHIFKIAGTAKVFGLDVPISEEITLGG